MEVLTGPFLKKGLEGIGYEGGEGNYTDCCSAVTWLIKGMACVYYY